MGPRYTREQILDAAVGVAGRTGLSGLSFRRVADEVGTSDRMVVYYFADKAQLLEAVLGRMGEDLQAVLRASLPPPRPGGVGREEVLRAARPVLTAPAQEPVLRLFVEAVGLGAAGQEPFATLVPRLLGGWIAWLEEQTGVGGRARGEAAATVAVIDGLAVVGLLLGPAAAAAAWDAVAGEPGP